jgi:hypothetical protein
MTGSSLDACDTGPGVNMSRTPITAHAAEIETLETILCFATVEEAARGIRERKWRSRSLKSREVFLVMGNGFNTNTHLTRYPRSE